MILYITIMVVTYTIAFRIQTTMLDDNIIEREGKKYRIFTRQDVINKIGMLTLFLILFSVSALRIYTGNDYRTYISHFHDIVHGNYVVTEEGFNAVVKAVYWFLGEENYLVIFAIFAFFTIFFFLRGIYEQSTDFALSFFLFMALGLYFQTFNTVRYYLALSMVLYSMKYIKRDEYLKFVFWIILASFFHKSVLVVIPLYLLARVPWKKWQVGILAILSLTGLFFESFFMQIFLRLYPSYLEQEELLAAGTSGISYTNIFRCVSVLVLALYIYHRNGGVPVKDFWFYFYLNLAAIGVYTCFHFIPFVSRIGYYLNISHIFYLPLLIKLAPSGKSKMLMKIIIFMAGVLYFLMFLMRADAINVKILPYASWMNADLLMEKLVN